mmetsp:Transcript_43740/g.114056  ORF Transcript_43740/g.114056 Transcript_43740/m.114056 type:complete len:86 (+) Transcript_43740:541-798(+)
MKSSACFIPPLWPLQGPELGLMGFYSKLQPFGKHQDCDTSGSRGEKSSIFENGTFSSMMKKVHLLGVSHCRELGRNRWMKQECVP